MIIKRIMDRLKIDLNLLNVYQGEMSKTYNSLMIVKDEVIMPHSESQREHQRNERVHYQRTERVYHERR